MNFLFAYFQDPNVMLLSSVTIQAQCLEEAVKLFYEKQPTAELLYVHNKKYELWK
jgi:hypothetical protein